MSASRVANKNLPELLANWADTLDGPSNRRPRELMRAAAKRIAQLEQLLMAEGKAETPDPRPPRKVEKQDSTPANPFIQQTVIRKSDGMTVRRVTFK